MAKDWKTAQNKEKEFWTNIYLSEKKDNIYNKTDARGWELFAEEVLTRNNLKKEFFFPNKCDEHWNSKGHKWAGEIISNYINKLVF